MAQTTVYQRTSDFIFDRVQTFMVLDTITWTVDADGEITNESSAKTAIKGVIQDLTEEDYPRISAGSIPQSDKKIYVRRDYTLHAGKYLVSTAVTQQFVYYPTASGSTTTTNAKKFEITKVERKADVGDNTPDETTSNNTVYSLAYLRELPV